MRPKSITIENESISYEKEAEGFPMMLQGNEEGLSEGIKEQWAERANPPPQRFIDASKPATQTRFASQPQPASKTVLYLRLQHSTASSSQPMLPEHCPPAVLLFLIKI